jgi:hypothetical protein
MIEEVLISVVGGHMTECDPVSSILKRYGKQPCCRWHVTCGQVTEFGRAALNMGLWFRTCIRGL